MIVCTLQPIDEVMRPLSGRLLQLCRPVWCAASYSRHLCKPPDSY